MSASPFDVRTTRLRRKILCRLLPPESLTPGDEVIFAKTPPPVGDVWVVEGPADRPSNAICWHQFVFVRNRKGGTRRRVWMGRLRVLRPVEQRVAERLMR